MKSMKHPLRTTWVLLLGLVLAVLSSGPAGAVSDDEGRLIRFAAHDKDNSTVRSLLAEGVSPNAPGNFDSRTAVHSAAKGGAANNLAAMLQAGGKPNVQDRDGDTPLHLASMGSFSGGFTDHAAAVRILLKHGADLHRTNNAGETALHVATHTGVGSAHPDVIKALLAAGANPQQVDGNGLTALQRFVRHGSDDGEIVALLIKAGADPDDKDSRGDAPLHAAIKTGGSNGKANVVEALLDGGANPCVRNARGYTPYHMSDDMIRIHQALDRAGGFDASHAGDSGCQMGSEDAPQMTDKGEESDEEASAALEPSGPDWIIAENQPCQRWKILRSFASVTYTWSGDCVGSKVSGEGRGVLQVPDGRKMIYEGSMRDGKRHGRGILAWPDGARYEGGWRDDKWHGQGTIIYSNGPSYEGEWRDGKEHGRGTYTSADGSRYEGEWRDGKKHGYGTMTFASGARYKGEWRDSKPHGQGTYTWPDGDISEGEWHHGCYKDYIAIGTNLEACGSE